MTYGLLDVHKVGLGQRSMSIAESNKSYCVR